MKKLMSAALIIAVLAALMCLTGCGGVSSSYRAVGLVHSNRNSHALVDFFSLEGRYVIQMKVKSAAGGTLCYSGELETGRATVYCITPGQETELFTLSAGESVDSTLPIPQKGRVYIIIQTEGVCGNGSFLFDII